MTQDARPLSAELVSEFAGTFIMVIFGLGVVAQVAVAGAGNWGSIAWAWGIGLTLGIFVAAHVSGAHLNPAVSVAVALAAGFPWRKVIPYSLAQTAGAFVAALLIRLNYNDMLLAADPGMTLKTQGVFSTLPANGAIALPGGESLVLGLGATLLDQIIATTLFIYLLFVVLAIPAARVLSQFAPMLIGLVLVGIGMALGANSGYAINPARDFGPRLASYLTGYGHAWHDQFGNLYFWVPIAGPLIGGVLAALLFIATRQVLFGVKPEVDARDDVSDDGSSPTTRSARITNG